MSGLETTGFSIKRLEEIKVDYEQAIEAEFGKINIDPDSNFGQLIGVLSRSDANLWEILESVYNSQYRNSASANSLDGVGSLIGVNRLKQLKSTLTAQATGDQGTVLAVGRIASTTSGIRFVSTLASTIDAASATGILVSVFTVADVTLYTITIDATLISFTSDASATDLEIIAGLKLAVDASPLAITGVDNLDGTMNITADDSNDPFVSSVTANLAIDKVTSNMLMEAEDFGVNIALATTLSVIDTPVSGWDSVNNILDAVVGRGAESDTAYRQRQEQSLQISGSSTVEAIRSRLLQVIGVTNVTVVENDTSIIDIDGRPPKSFECIVAGGTDIAVATEIFLSKAAGIQAYGGTVVPITDSQGLIHQIGLSRATNIYIWFEITLTKSTEITYPADGDQRIKDGVVEIGSTYTLGDNVLTQEFYVAVFAVDGIETAVVEVATSATPAGPPGAFAPGNIAIAPTEVAVFDSGRVTIL